MTWIDDGGEDTDSYRQSICCLARQVWMGRTHYKSQFYLIPLLSSTSVRMTASVMSSFVPPGTDRACRSNAVARAAGALARRTSVKRRPHIPALRHWAGRAGHLPKRASVTREGNGNSRERAFFRSRSGTGFLAGSCRSGRKSATP